MSAPVLAQAVAPAEAASAPQEASQAASQAGSQAALQAASQAAPQTVTLPAVRVKAKGEQETATSPVQGYAARRSATATKTDTPLIETGQSISVITRERIEAIGATTLVDALGYTPGVRGSPFGQDSRYDWTTMRGFDAYSPGYFLDGLVARNNAAWSTWRVDSYGAERIEVLRGPASVLYGQNGPGGLINVVSKRPTAEPLREFDVQLGSFSRRQVAADVSGPLDDEGELLYRVTGLVRKSDTQVDYVRDDRTFIAPAFTWRPSADTTFTVLSHFQHDRSGSTVGFLPTEGVITPNPNGRIPVSTFVGEPGYDRFNKDQWAVGYALEHKPSDTWTLRQNARYGEIDLDYAQLIANGFVLGDSRTIERSIFGSREKVNALTLDNQAQARFAAAGWQHTVLIGLDYQRNRFDQRTFFGPGPRLDVYAPVYGQPITEPAPNDDSHTALTQTGVYLQEQAKLGERWVLSAGVRYDDAKAQIEGRLPPPDDISSVTKNHKFTKRAGVVYLMDDVAPYISYSESFSPVGIPNFLPETGRQYEAGVRYEPANQRASYTAAVYDLRRQNYVTYDPATFEPQQTGEVLVRGLELEAIASPRAGSNFTAAYTWTPTMRITKSVDPNDIGKSQTSLPKHTLALWADHRFATGLRLGLGARYNSSTRGDLDASPAPIPGVTLVDALVGYEFERWHLALNVRNLTDKVYVSNCGATNCYYGAARTVNGTVSYRY